MVPIEIAITLGTITVPSVLLTCQMCIDSSSILSMENVVDGGLVVTSLCARVHAIAILWFQ
jgi:hypothetical protein